MFPNIHAKNAVVFIADSLRFDHLPVEIANLGMSMKAVASTLSSPGSFSSIVTGLSPFRHNVMWWQDQLLTPRVFDLDGINTSFWNVGVALQQVLNDPPSISLEEINPPFIYIERDLVPHMPYIHDSGYTAKSYFLERGTSVRQIQEDYAYAVNMSAKKFFTRLETLVRRKLIEDTLVIFTSDHGELLGEYGLIGHNSPACPELVYVPAVFIHPEIDVGNDTEERIITHVDLLPTVLEVIGKKPLIDLDGTGVFSDKFSQHYVNIQNSKTYSAVSVWDDLGGHIFLKSGKFTTFIQMMIRIVTPHWSCARFAFSNLNFLSMFTKSYQTFGTPAFSKSEALNAINDIRSGQSYTAGQQELNEEVKERLRSLGYLE